MQPHVFVLMPSGVKEVQAATATLAADVAAGKSAIKISFNEVYELLVEPALTKAGSVSFRALEETHDGEIRTDAFFELVTADIILADISIPDANVFYQLGVRHGVRPNGVLMMHGGWTQKPLEIAPERIFDYDGRLFVSQKEERDQGWQERLEAEVEKLATAFESAIDVDEQTIKSPVYKELTGLRPVDWSAVRAKRSKYFGEVFADWKSHVETARRQGWPGDILTFADEAPTRFHRAELLWQAWDALCEMHRLKAARTVLQELLILDAPGSDTQARNSLALSRMERAEKEGAHEQRFKKVLVASGHMIDKPGRPRERFPARKEEVARERIASQLEGWNVGANDLAICGGARGADILFAELCLERGAEVWLFLALPESEFLEESVRLPESNWEQRYFTLRDRQGVKVFLQGERLKQPPAGASVYSRNNLWMINTARVEADDPKNLYAVLVWDEQPTGDGAGGTSDFAERVRNMGGHLAPVINPTKL